MGFLDNFSFAFQNITLFSKSYTEWKYWENIEGPETQTDFQGVIQKKKDYSDVFLDNNKNIRFTSMDFSLRCPVAISAKKWDRITCSWLEYNVIYPYPPVMINWVHDHNVCIIRLND